MCKSFFILGSVLLFFNTALAQKKSDTAVYYLTNAGKVVSKKEDADLFLFILPPDTTVDKKLYIVQEYYSNGKPALIGNSLTDELDDLKFQGAQITFFPNGHKAIIKNYDDGQLVGDVMSYYPNGKLYNIKTYTKTVTEETDLKLKSCSDSTGKMLAENGNGKWIKVDNTFDKIIEEGPIENGHEEGEWHSIKNDTIYLINEYKNGRIVSSANSDKFGHKTFFSVEKIPEFPGGFEAFGRFIGRTLRYPVVARENNKQGRVIISFVVEKDGSLTDIKVARGIGYGCDDEAIRVIKLSPRWKPGMHDGTPVRVAFSVPIGFTISN
jgi:TonB family protein